jgi:hypothetical protein
MAWGRSVGGREAAVLRLEGTLKLHPVGPKKTQRNNKQKADTKATHSGRPVAGVTGTLWNEGDLNKIYRFILEFSLARDAVAQHQDLTVTTERSATMESARRAVQYNSQSHHDICVQFRTTFGVCNSAQH